MNEHLNPAVYGHYAALINHPAYYYLYGLYADYQVNNAFILPREHQEQVREKLRTIQSLLWYFRPYRKSHSLRLFTERESMARFPAHLVSEAWSELHEFIAQMGPPPGWSESPREARPRRGGRPRHSAR
ncbi:MAG: hypothetical protein OEZ59_12955, partial [Deltaproteobacteria bacterium]|nr:hypothetical protein [Deltaproteobacteria bacterium]